MITKDMFLAGLSRCDIFFENEKISNVCIIKKAIGFFASGFYDEPLRRRTLLHTGSIAYDAIAVLLSALADVLVFYVKNDDFLTNLKPGDIVVDTQYGRRLRRVVREVKFGESIKLLENARTNCLYTMAWSMTRFLEPNPGSGRKIGGAGLRQEGVRAREKFFEYAFGIASNDLPRTPKSHTVIVASREYAQRIYRGIVIEAKSNDNEKIRVRLSDIAGAIFVTPEQNITLGGALSNDDSVLRFCSSLSMAKDMISEARQTSLLVISNDALMAYDAAVYNRLSSMKKKNFVVTSIAIGSSAVDKVIQNVEDGGGSILSHTKRYLKSLSRHGQPGIGIIGEIWSQVQSSINRNIYVEKVDGFLSAEQYREWLDAIRAFKSVQYDYNVKADFLDEAYGLFSFLRGSVFKMSDIDKLTDFSWRGRTLSPVARIEGLTNMSSSYPSDIKCCSDRIISVIKDAYAGLKSENKKQEILEHIISKHSGSRIAVIVPQDGFKAIFEKLGDYRIQMSKGMLTIATPNSFGRGTNCGSRDRYDMVVSIGGMEGRRFSPFLCSQANEVRVLLYAIEANRFINRGKDSIRKERVLNNKSTYSEYAASVENKQNYICEDDNRFEAELDVFLKEFREREDRLLAEQYGKLPGHNRNVDVVKIGTLDSGEKIFFTKFFRPYVIDETESGLKEVELDEVITGDTLLFMQNNEACKDIVDVMLNDYIAAQHSRSKIEDMLAKTKRWRELLRTYSTTQQLSAVDIAEKMKEMGSTIHEVTVRNWLDEESHLVGPRNKSSFEYIAQLTGDQELLAHIDDYFEACKMIRERRIKLLHELGRQIKGNIASGKLAKEESVGIEIATKVKDMVKLCMLENLTDAPENLCMNTLYVNRPITIDMKVGA